jgi:Zn finger protein HypA/HybF involved in hydrogenase expression
MHKMWRKKVKCPKIIISISSFVIKNNYFTYFKQELVMFFLTMLYGQIASIFIGNYKKKDFVESKKCMNCIRRVDIEKYKCPYCGSLYFHITGN